MLGTDISEGSSGRAAERKPPYGKAQRLTNNLNGHLSWPACLDQPVGWNEAIGLLTASRRSQGKPRGATLPYANSLQATAEILNHCSTNIGDNHQPWSGSKQIVRTIVQVIG